MNSMSILKKHFTQLMLIGLCFQPGICEAEWSKEDRLQEKQQLDLWQNKLAALNDLHEENQIEDLALGLRSMAFRKTFGDRDPRTDLIYSGIQSALLATPKHAEYYGDKIQNAQENLKNVWADPNLRWPAYQTFLNEQMYGFDTLAELPSAENVRVLGEMLSNEWVPPGNETAPASEKLPPLANRATGTLMKLPIKNKPAAFTGPVTRETIIRDLPAWRLWYEQIRSGKRTFSFEGDTTEYDLNGPAPKEKLIRIEQGRKRDEKRAAGLHKSPAVQDTGAVLTQIGKPSAIAGVLAALGVFVAAVWYGWRRKKAAQG